MLSTLEHELEVATRAARAAGDVILAYYEGRIDVREKSRDNPVTDADLEADRTIREAICEAFPEDGWLSEETADSAERLSRRRVWIVDPLDGTKEFIQKIPEFCVCIGLVEDGRPRLGVSYNPARDELFRGVVGEGATYRGQPASVSDTAEPARARVLASRSEDKRGEWDAYKDKVQVVLTGSVAYKLALIAAGKEDATFSLTPKNEWDICAGVALIEAAGGLVTDPDGQPLRFNRPKTKVPGLIAANPRLHAALRQLIRDVEG